MVNCYAQDFNINSTRIPMTPKDGGGYSEYRAGRSLVSQILVHTSRIVRLDTLTAVKEAF